MGFNNMMHAMHEYRAKYNTVYQRNLFLQQSQYIVIFSAYTDVCTLSCKIVVASKRPLILNYFSFVVFLYALTVERLSDKDRFYTILGLGLSFGTNQIYRGFLLWWLSRNKTSARAMLYGWFSLTHKQKRRRQ